MLRFVSDHERRRAAAEAEIKRFVQVTGEADFTTPVPGCPGWTISDLVRHVGTVHRWTTHNVLDRPDERIAPQDLDVGVPADESGYLGWLADAGERLTTALRETDPDLRAGRSGPTSTCASGPGASCTRR